MLLSPLPRSPAFLEQEVGHSWSSPQTELLSPALSAPQPRELLMIEEETERLAGELKEVRTHTYVCPCACPLHWSCHCPRFLTFDLVFHSQVLKNRNSLRTQLIQLRQYRAILTLTHSLTETQVQCECGCDVFSFGSIVSVCVCFQFACTLPPSLDTMECGQDMHLRLVHFPLFLSLSVWALYKSVLCPASYSFVVGVVHSWRVLAFERLLWRACRGYIIADFQEMEERLETPETVVLILLFLFGFIEQVFLTWVTQKDLFWPLPLIPGWTGEVDGLPHIILGRHHWSQSPENLWLVSLSLFLTVRWSDGQQAGSLCCS